MEILLYITSINTALKNIKANPHFGDIIPRIYVSKATTNKYGTDKILRIELISYWRLLYTLIGDEIKIVAFILEYMDHNKYNKIFGYKKKQISNPFNTFLRIILWRIHNLRNFISF